MSSRRFFKNPYSDYVDTEDCVVIDNRYWTGYLEELAVYCVKKTKLTEQTCDGGLYTGSLGLVYMIHKVLENGFCKNYENDLKKYASDALSVNADYLRKNRDDRSMRTSFVLGNCGFFAIKSLIDGDKRAKYAQKYAEAAKTCEREAYLRDGCDELFVGRAGVLCGLLFYRHKMGVEVLPDADVFRILDAVIRSGRGFAQKHTHSPCSLLYSYYGTQYIGAAHGLASIYQMVLSFPKYLSENPEAEKELKACVDFLVSIQTSTGNFPCDIDELKHKEAPEDEKIHWCHGAAGVVYCLAKAYLVWKEEKYLNSCRLCSDCVWNYGLLKKGPGICHGVAGNGYVHLLLYRLTNEKKYLYRASKFAEFLESQEFKTQAQRPDSPFSLYEGLAGTVCFLVDLLNPKQAEFPFFDVFN